MAKPLPPTRPRAQPPVTPVGPAVDPFADDDMDETLAGPIQGDGIDSLRADPPSNRMRRQVAGDVRDTLGNDPRQARKRAAVALSQQRERNPFFDEVENPMPRLPRATPEWTYQWKRWRIEGQDDKQNMHVALTGRHLRWEPLTAEMLPPEDADGLAMFAHLEGKYSGHIIHNDLIACRAPTRMVQLFNEFEQEKGREQIMRTRQATEFRQHARAAGHDSMVEDDVEQYGSFVDG
jgi:hypothetical protein